MRSLPCGCRLCGCLCEAHAPAGVPEACPGCRRAAVARWLITDFLALAALGGFAVAVGVGAALLCGG